MSIDDEQLEELLRSLNDPESSDERKRILSTLTPQQAKALRKRFGRFDWPDTPASLEDVQKQFRVTRERIRQIEEKALRRLGKTPPVREGIECSFCGKYESEVKKIISWDTGVTICNECVETAKEMVDEKE